MVPKGWMLLMFFSAVVLACILWRRHLRSCGAELGLAWLPKELRGTELAYAEKMFRASGDISIVARLDRAYRNRNGLIILAELKTREKNRPYFSDVIELSAQRVALQAEIGERVAEFGYVIVQLPGSLFRFAHRVDLMSADDVCALAKRREHLLRGQVVPKYSCSSGLCATCPYAEECEISSWS
jgi:CRISPR-associated exonuclease Cas4